MQTIFQILHSRFSQTLERIVGSANVDPMLTLATDPKFGDYQSNVAMGLAKKLKKSPRDVAQDIIKALVVSDLCSLVEIAGPGFINLHLKPEVVTKHLSAVVSDERLGIEKVRHPVHHVIDFSSPNLAKEMHVGHLRTTITGEVISRVIEFMGHTVARVNHVGDWGTQFGMLLNYIYTNHPEIVKNPDSFHVADLEVIYKKAKKQFDEDPNFAEQSRQKVVLLQSGDVTAISVWKAFLKESLKHCHEIYDLLDVKLNDIGESFYNNRLSNVVDDLLKRGLAKRDQGAVCVFLEGYKNREGEPLPVIVQKSDGGFNYDTTDLAALRYRVDEQKGKRLIYITDIRQAQHFDMLFAVARQAGWVDQTIDLRHIGYGMILGTDRTPFKTREGNTVKLKELIEEAIKRALSSIKQNREDLDGEKGLQFSAEQQEAIASAVGLAAIKYADLSHNLASDYVFDWNKMLAFEGNTGPYMLYAYARIMSIGRKAGLDLKEADRHWRLALEHPAELALAKVLTRFGDVLSSVYESLRPNLLTDYLYDVSKAFSTFYDKKLGVSVLNAETQELKESRLLLCHLTARTLRLGLNLLSIQVVEAM